ncbi:hypothetical protein A235_36246, partial [Pseudomonas syringae pv. actinidiae ICMP 19079]
MILAEGRGSELVREDFSSDDAFSEDMPAFSRTMRIAAPVALTTFGQNQKQCCGQRECSATVQRRASALSTGAAGAAFDYAHRRAGHRL